MPRDQFHYELQRLQEELLVMASMVENAIERSVLVCKTGEVIPGDLPETIREEGAPAPSSYGPGPRARDSRKVLRTFRD